MTTQTKAADPVRWEAFERWLAGMWHVERVDPTDPDVIAFWSLWQIIYAQARADLIAELRPALYGVAIYGGDLCAATYSTPAEAEAFVLRVNALRRMDRDPCVVVPLAIIPKE